MKRAAASCAFLLALAGCAFVPQHHEYLDRAEIAYRAATADPAVQRYAGTELRAAAELLERAQQARDTLQDAAEVDHLAYLARQKVEIAREVARIRETNP